MIIISPAASDYVFAQSHESTHFFNFLTAPGKVKETNEWNNKRTIPVTVICPNGKISRSVTQA